MRLRTPDNLTHLTLVVLALALLAPVGVCADEVAWIAGVSAPAEWSIEPQEPNEADVIRFSGPTPAYLNRCIAEYALDGKPTLQINPVRREVRLVFEGPADEDCKESWAPVRGLKGSFGPLAAGSWIFFCTQGKVAFSIPFEVWGGARQTVYYVDTRARGIANGATWADAFPSLQSALAVAGQGVEIRVGQGVYRPNDGFLIGSRDLDATFELKNGVTLKGGYAGLGGVDPDARDLVAYETILSGDLQGNDASSVRLRQLASHAGRADNARHVVTAVGVDETAVLDGFTIRGGHAFGSEWAESLTCGGGIYISSASPMIRDCTILNNSAAFYGGGVYLHGEGTPTFTDCVIADNWSEWRGGGVYKDWGSGGRLDRCLVSSNGSGFDGAGIASHTDGELFVSNSLFSGNITVAGDTGRGGALYCFLATVRLDHCTFVGNLAPLGSTLACAATGEPTTSNVRFSNCILWDAGSAILNDDSSKIEITYSDVRGGWSGLGNLNADPCFMDPGQWNTNGTLNDLSDDRWQDGDYRLAYRSPCVNAGNPASQPGGDEADLNGNPRRIGPAVDMGAYEDDLPTADAGPDVAGFSLDGQVGNATLDASRSRHPVGRPLTCRWYRDGQLVSTKSRFTIELPVGEHRFTLIVNDGSRDSPPDEVLATIAPPVATVVLISPGQIDREQVDQSIIALIALPAGKHVVDFDSNQPVLLFPGGIEATAQTLVPWLKGRVYAMAKFDRARLLAAVPTDGPVELKVVGALKSGRYFSGADTVQIK